MIRKQYPDGAWTVKVPGKRLKSVQSDLDKLAGDGRFGFQSRPESEGVASVESVADGKTLFRSARKSICHPRKSTRRLITKAEVIASNRPAEWASPRAVRRMEKKLRRKAARAAR